MLVEYTVASGIIFGEISIMTISRKCGEFAKDPTFWKISNAF
jgi:hypothetical protein